MHEITLRFGTGFRAQHMIPAITLQLGPCSAWQGTPLTIQKPASVRQQLRTVHTNAKRRGLGFTATHVESFLKCIQYPWEAGHTDTCLQRRKLNYERLKDWPKGTQPITQSNRIGPGPLGLSSKPVLWDPWCSTPLHSRKTWHAKNAKMPGPHPGAGSQSF